MLKRLAAAAVLGLMSATVALASPASATPGFEPIVEFTSECDGTVEVKFGSPDGSPRTWRVLVDDEPHPDGSEEHGSAGTFWQPAGETVVVTAPSGAELIAVDWHHNGAWKSDTDETYPKTGTWSHPDPGGDACGTPTVEVISDTCDSVQLQFTNPTDGIYDADVRVDGEPGTPDDEMPADHNHGVTPGQLIANGPHAGEEFGLRFQPVRIGAGKATSYEVGFEEGSGEHTVAYRIWRGPENDYYVPWVELTVDCGDKADDSDAGDDTEVVTASDTSDEAAALPNTGSPVLTLLLAGGGIVAAGLMATVGAMWWRRRTPTFAAE